MANFELPRDLVFNTRKLADPDGFARENAASGWLYLNGEEFAAMEGGMSYAQVLAAVPHAANVITDPPRELDLALARRHVSALDDLPRPTLVTCRSGPRASAVAYMYAGLRADADPDDVIAAARAADAPFMEFADYIAWVRASILALRAETARSGQ